MTSTPPGVSGRPLLRTERLELRPMTPEHLPFLVELDADPEVLRYILGRARTPEEATAFWSPRAADTEADRRSLGWWAGFVDDQFVGWWDLAPNPEDRATAEIGWRVRRDHWRRGLATEGAQALLQHAFTTVGLARVWAETMAVNMPSRGVMTKIGMRHIRTEVRIWDDPLPGAEQGEVIYAITRAEWQAGRLTMIDNSPSPAT